jgi:biopolymer transport protein TolQ
MPPLNLGTGAFSEFLTNSGPVAKVVLVILLLLSVFSWAIIFRKSRLFRRMRQQSRRFLKAFHKSGRLSDMHAIAETFRPAPMAEIFEASYEEWVRQMSGLRSLTAVERVIRAAVTEQITGLESGLNWLATIAGASPFIGLFGTVWGIIDAFHGLGAEGAATLRAVAPGISEALVTTAAGLFAAVPALIGYNALSHRVREFAAGSDEFGLELQNRMEELAGSGAISDAAGVTLHARGRD